MGKIEAELYVNTPMTRASPSQNHHVVMLQFPTVPPLLSGEMLDTGEEALAHLARGGLRGLRAGGDDGELDGPADAHVAGALEAEHGERVLHGLSLGVEQPGAGHDTDVNAVRHRVGSSGRSCPRCARTWSVWASAVSSARSESAIMALRTMPKRR